MKDRLVHPRPGGGRYWNVIDVNSRHRTLESSYARADAVGFCIEKVCALIGRCFTSREDAEAMAEIPESVSCAVDGINAVLEKYRRIGIV